MPYIELADGSHHLGALRNKFQKKTMKINLLLLFSTKIASSGVFGQCTLREADVVSALNLAEALAVQDTCCEGDGVGVFENEG